MPYSDETINTESNNNLEEPSSISKEEKIFRERKKVLSNLSACRLGDLQSKVAWILNNHPETRNSDIKLQIKYWEYFEDKYDPSRLKPEDLLQLSRLTSISRARAKIQNEYNLFLASDEVRKRRGTLAEEERLKSVESASFTQTFSIFADESGKNSENLLVGSLWLADGSDSWKLVQYILEWKRTNNINEEIHFTKINEGKLNKYKELVNIVLTNFPTLSFKAVSVKSAGIADKQAAFSKLFYHLIIKGIEHENSSNRAPLPRGLSFFKDAEEEGYDQLLIAEVTNQLKQAAKTIFANKLHIDTLEAVDSKASLILQIADLFVSSISRSINHNGDGNHPKDKFTQYFLNSVGIEKTLPDEYQQDDMAIHMKL